MNIEQAKTVALYDLLIKLGFKPTRENAEEAWFLSPLRDEKTASFKVNKKKNVWYDHGEGIGGDNIKFVCVHLERQNESHTVSDALRYISNMTGYVPSIAPVQSSDDVPRDPKLFVQDVKEIEHLALVYYLEKRGVPVKLARPHLKQVQVQNKETGKGFFALGLLNEEGGYELRNPFFKGSVGKKSISFIRGTVPKPEGVHVFEGFMDYLSILADVNRECLDDDAIILNSLSCLKHATPYIKNYGYKTAWTWMDNDEAGQKATQSLEDFFKTERELSHRPMNEAYTPYKDVNNWLVQKLKLPE
jgi:hypothetical protein